MVVVDGSQDTQAQLDMGLSMNNLCPNGMRHQVEGAPYIGGADVSG